MSKSIPKLSDVTSTFAIVEIKLGRRRIEKLVRSSHEISFTLSGTINPGGGGIGPSDKVGTEFAADVKRIRLGKPKFIPCDKHGRPYALAKNMRPGVTLECDDAFTCMKSRSKRVVKRYDGPLKGADRSKLSRLYIDCKDGQHFLDGQLGEHGELVGLYQVKAS